MNYVYLKSLMLCLYFEYKIRKKICRLKLYKIEGFILIKKRKLDRELLKKSTILGINISASLEEGKKIFLIYISFVDNIGKRTPINYLLQQLRLGMEKSEFCSRL